MNYNHWIFWSWCLWLPREYWTVYNRPTWRELPIHIHIHLNGSCLAGSGNIEGLSKRYLFLHWQWTSTVHCVYCTFYLPEYMLYIHITTIYTLEQIYHTALHINWDIYLYNSENMESMKSEYMEWNSECMELDCEYKELNWKYLKGNNSIYNVMFYYMEWNLNRWDKMWNIRNESWEYLKIHSE